jgi:hypothetical protein
VVTHGSKIGPVAPIVLNVNVVDEAVDDTVLEPTPFTVVVRNAYVVEFERPVTVADVVVEVPSANVVQVDPPSDEYSTV